jgi:hypothetical protein
MARVDRIQHVDGATLYERTILNQEGMIGCQRAEDTPWVCHPASKGSKDFPNVGKAVAQGLQRATITRLGNSVGRWKSYCYEVQESDKKSRDKLCVTPDGIIALMYSEMLHLELKMLDWKVSEAAFEVPLS